jgi:hypothetical protein
LKSKLLKKISQPVLNRNEKFKNTHEGETCYIVGNGGSLKNMDLSVFSDHPVIGINSFGLHKDAKSMNYLYQVLVEPYFFYPYLKNPYNHKYQRNIFGKVFKKSFKEHSNTKLFTSISNIFGNNLKNVHFLHHFGNRTPDKNICDISGDFSFMQGGFAGALGLAISLGFKKAYLLGIDYLMTPMVDGHFYAYDPAYVGGKSGDVYGHLYREVEDLIELSIIADQGTSTRLPCQTYEEFCGKKISYRHNHDIIKEEYLSILRQAVELEQYCRKV